MAYPAWALALHVALPKTLPALTMLQAWLMPCNSRLVESNQTFAQADKLTAGVTQQEAEKSGHRRVHFGVPTVGTYHFPEY